MNSQNNNEEPKLFTFTVPGKIWPAKKPDSDNIAKVVLDALNGIAYHDDTQIIKLSVTKAYKEEAYLSVTLMELK